MTEADAKKIYEQYAIPDTGKPIFESLFDDFNRNAPDTIDYNNNNRSPLLLIAGENDHTVPATAPNLIMINIMNQLLLQIFMNLKDVVI